MQRTSDRVRGVKCRTFRNGSKETDEYEIVDRLNVAAEGRKRAALYKDENIDHGNGEGNCHH